MRWRKALRRVERTRIVEKSVTRFQEDCKDHAEAVIQGFSRIESRPFVLMKGREEDYLYADLRYDKRLIEVYIYEDEAGYMINGKRWRIFEKPDFSGPEELMHAFSAALREECLRTESA